MAAVLDVAGQPGALTAVLTAEGGGGPTGLAAVSAAGDVTLAMQRLPPTTGTQVYEAWVIGGDGVPVAARRLPGRRRRDGHASRATGCRPSRGSSWP